LALDRLPPLAARVFVSENGLEVGIGNPSVIDDSLAPSGCAALTMLCLLPESEQNAWPRHSQDYQPRKKAWADRLIDVAERTVLPGLRRQILHCEVASPATFARYASTGGGAIYGMARGQRCPGLQTPLPGLMLVGAGTTTGAGIEAVVVSATVAANRIRPSS
jgi:phytoene dehydrogenase-like protein